MQTISEGNLSIELTDKYGEIVSLEDMAKILGYKTASAVKYAIKKEQLTIQTFFIKGRKGRFAMTRNIASWLIECSENNSQSTYDNNLRSRQKTNN